METNGHDPEQIPRRERKKLQDREEIIAAASELFARSGYEQTSMQMIAERAELSVGKLYLHFDGKETIYREVVEHHTALMRERLEVECGREPSPMQRIRCRMRAALSYIEENIAFARFYLAEAGGDMTTCREPAHEEMQQITEELLGEAIERGEIVREDPRLLAALIHGAVHWLTEIALKDDSLPISAVPELIDRIILTPLERRTHETRQGENGR
jgi:AcrR family transcriptional regulator